MKKVRLELCLLGVMLMFSLLVGCQAGQEIPEPSASATPDSSEAVTSPQPEEEVLPKASWGDDIEGGRPVYTKAEVADGALGEEAVLNSLTDSIIGDAHYFIYAQNETGGEISNSFKVQDGETYNICMYVQNDNPGTVSTGTRAMISVPVASEDGLCQVLGVAQSENATTKEVWSTLMLSSDQDFCVKYVYGSAKLINAAYADGLTLDDALVTKAASENGILIGYERLNGSLPGGEAYLAVVSIQIEIEALGEPSEA